MTVLGLHHITLVSADAQRTVDFYTKVLGLRLVKKTVNFDDPGSYHLYFGDELGRPGSAVTFFEWPHAVRGKPGIGGTHHFALVVEDIPILIKWKRRLSDLGISVDGPLDRVYYNSIYFRDPDGVILEIATRGPGWTVDENADRLGSELIIPPAEPTSGSRDVSSISAQMWPEPVNEISNDMRLSQGMHHITLISSDLERTHSFFGELLGLRRVKMTSSYDNPTSAHWYWGVGAGKPGTIVTSYQRPPGAEPRARIGAGQTHHFALAVPDEYVQLEWREKLLRAGLRVTPVLDRIYFKSIYTNDPDGHIIELATIGPGFTVDEDPATLGQSLKLPPWLESYRSDIETTLSPIHSPEWLQSLPEPHGSITS